MANTNVNLDLDKLKKECLELIEVINNLVTVISDKSMLTVSDKELEDYKIQFVKDCNKLELKLKTLKNFKADVSDVMVEYNKLNSRIDNKEFKALVKKKDIEQEITTREAQKMVDDMLKKIEDEMGIDPSEVKIVTMKKPSSKPLSIILDIITTLIMNVLLMLSLSGFLNFESSKTIYHFLMFIGYYSAIEILLKIIINLYFQKYIIKTFGMIMLIPALFSFVISYLFPLGLVKIESVFVYLIVCLLCFLIKKYVASYFLEKSLAKLTKKKK